MRKNDGYEFPPPLQKRTLVEEVVAILKRFILEEGLKKGDRLPAERSLTETFGVSLRVVREALSRLEGEGIIFKEHGRGVFIKNADPRLLHDNRTDLFSDPADLHKLRCAIEVGSLCIAIEHATAEDIEKLQEMVHVMAEKNKRGEGIAAEEIHFHIILLEASYNKVLKELGFWITESLRLKMYDNPGLLFHSDNSPVIIASHQAVVDALRDRDLYRAIQVLHPHLKRGWSPGYPLVNKEDKNSHE